jgi:hypothetical protein
MPLFWSQYTRRVMNLIVVIIKKYHSYQLHKKFREYPSLKVTQHADIISWDHQG